MYITIVTINGRTQVQLEARGNISLEGGRRHRIHNTSYKSNAEACAWSWTSATDFSRSCKYSAAQDQTSGLTPNCLASCAYLCKAGSKRYQIRTLHSHQWAMLLGNQKQGPQWPVPVEALWAYTQWALAFCRPPGSNRFGANLAFFMGNPYLMRH